jgi:hypothetical protein
VTLLEGTGIDYMAGKSIKQTSMDHCCICSRHRFFDECVYCPYIVKIRMRGGYTRRVCVFGLDINTYSWYRSLSSIY